MSPRTRLVLAAVLFSTAGAAIKWCGFGGWQVAAFRALVALFAILALIPETRRSWTWRAGVVGFAYAGAGILFVLANKLTTAASTIFLQATNPLFILALAPWLLHEPISRRDLVFMTILALGLALLFLGVERPVATAPNPFLGNLLAAGSAISWAFTVVGFRWLVTQDGDSRGAVASAAASGNLIVFLTTLPMAWPLAAGRPVDWLVVAFLGVFQLGLAYVFLSRAITEVAALEASLVLLVEPVLSPIWAWLVHGETPGALALTGGAVILAATGLKSWQDARRAPLVLPTGAA